MQKILSFDLFICLLADLNSRFIPRFNFHSKPRSLAAFGFDFDFDFD